jgi:hypothetical protein
VKNFFESGIVYLVKIQKNSKSGRWAHMAQYDIGAQFYETNNDPLSTQKALRSPLSRCSCQSTEFGRRRRKVGPHWPEFGPVRSGRESLSSASSSSASCKPRLAVAHLALSRPCAAAFGRGLMLCGASSWYAASMPAVERFQHRMATEGVLALVVFACSLVSISGGFQPRMRSD